MPDWKRIGCAVDFSDGSRAAFQEASDLARRFDATLVLLHAEETPGVSDIPPPASVVEAARAEFQARLAGWQAEAASSLGRAVEARVFPGPAAPAIARVAGEERL